MTPERFRSVGDLYHRALNEHPGDRLRFIAENCAGDRELQAEVESLLAADAQASGFLSVPAKEVAAQLLTGQASPSEIPIPPGQLIGPYRVVRKIGSGGMGHVYLAEDTRLGRKVALKCLQAGVAASSRGLARLVEEARAASALNHPNIITVYDLVESDGQQFIAAEFIEGETLRERMTRTRLSAAEIADIGAQTANALGAAHAAGIVHGDIKPANIMVRADGLVKVLDFGLARQSAPAEPGATPSGRETSPMGTLLYMSPEQLLRKPVDARTDIFSLGVVLYEMAVGKTPFRGDADAAVWYSLLNDSPARLRDLRPEMPERLERLIARALEKEPDGRYQSATEMSDQLRALAKLPPKGRRIWKAIAVAALISAALCAAWAWFTQPLPPPRVTRIAQITGDPGLKQYFVDDGSTVYYGRGNEDPESKVLRVSVEGGEPVIMPQLTGMFPLDISHDGSQLLLGQFLKGTANGPFPVWVASTAGGAPRRVGTLMADWAHWSPKGDEIVYTSGRELRIARGDGSGSHGLVTLDGLLLRPVWSPDGRLIRFTVLAKNSMSLWEVAKNGTGLHAVFPEWSDRSNQEGAWSGDGRNFVFSAMGDLWMVPGDRRGSPVRLTHGPFRARYPRYSPHSDRILFAGFLNRGELVRYDRKADRWHPYLGGLPGAQLNYSRDGQWITWVSYPEGTVWRGRLDGSARQELTRSPFHAVSPQWSPDDSKIAFFGSAPGQPNHIYIVPANGGELRQLTHGEGGPGGEVDATWSPDGGSLVFGSSSLDAVGNRRLQVVGVNTGRISTVAESDGLWAPTFSPDGRYLLTLGSSPVFHLWLYDVQTHARTQLTKTGAGWGSWSRDSRYIYFEDNATTTWYRVRIRDQRVERLASLSGLSMAPSTFGWIGLTPEGDLISTRDTGSTEIYALDLDTR